uniref:Immunoglobulin domain-containing protein n=1 Tax=Salmo trutta TaxID=8032 RepID=A0A673WTJ4_SALTR
MKILHIVSCCLLSALCVVESAVTNVEEVVGGQVTVGCTFTLAGNNNKYFCKGTCSGEDILVETNGSKNVTQDIYSIEDKGGLFYVTIKDLRKSDSGTYWCGVDRSIKDTFQEVHLTVTDAPPETSTFNSRPNVSTTLLNLSTTFMASGDISIDPSQRTVTQVVIMVCVSPVLVVGLILLLIYKWRNRKTSTSKHSARPLVSDSMTTNQDPDTGTITNPIYATATNHNPDTTRDITTT